MALTNGGVETLTPGSEGCECNEAIAFCHRYTGCARLILGSKGKPDWWEGDG